jgi:hypothetical protein
MENIGSTWLTRSLEMRLWIWAQWLDRTCNRADEASFELHGMRRREWCIVELEMIGWL